MANSPDITDLNALLPARKKVSFGEKVYEIPGDMPMDIYLRTQIAFGDETDEVEGTKQLRQAFVELLTFYYPADQERKDAVEARINDLGVPTILKLLGAVYKDAEEKEDEARDEGNDSSVPEATTEAETQKTTGTSQSEPSPTPS